jgi:hypothetical protein
LATVSVGVAHHQMDALNPYYGRPELTLWAHREIMQAAAPCGVPR